MKRIIATLLLVGALLGLFGAEFAAARSVAAPSSAPTAAQMDADCIGMMGQQQPQPKKKPCNGLTLQCIAAMGCVLPLAAVDPASDMAASGAHGTLGFWTTTNVLVGQTFGPDPEPPTP